MPIPDPSADPVIAYYEELAPRYDADRFGNSYGRVIHDQERRLLSRWLHGLDPTFILDLACGTGRMLMLAGQGADPSPGMLEAARRQFPDRKLHLADARALPLPEKSLDAVFCLHLFMHLGVDEAAAIGREVRRVLRPGGRFVLDVPSALRRRLRPRPPVAPAWHGASAYTRGQVLGLFPEFELRDRVGLLGVPLQRLPPRTRPWAAPLDRGFGRIFPDLSAYTFYHLERRP